MITHHEYCKKVRSKRYAYAKEIDEKGVAAFEQRAQEQRVIPEPLPQPQ